MVEINSGSMLLFRRVSKARGLFKVPLSRPCHLAFTHLAFIFASLIACSWDKIKSQIHPDVVNIEHCCLSSNRNALILQNCTFARMTLVAEERSEKRHKSWLHYWLELAVAFLGPSVAPIGGKFAGTGNSCRVPFHPSTPTICVLKRQRQTLRQRQIQRQRRFFFLLGQQPLVREIRTPWSATTMSEFSKPDALQSVFMGVT